MKTVGIIGGLGPETTADFYLKVVMLWSKHHRSSRPSIMIYNVPVSKKIENDMIIKAKNSQACLNHLISSAKRLEKSGVDFIVIPCNTVHMYINEVKKSVKIPVLSIIDESLAYLKKNSCDEIGMLATSSTLNSGIYSKAFIKMGISVQIPSVKNQKIINEIIYKIISNSHTEEDKCQLENIMDEFYTNGARAILLACTDLQVAVKKHRNLILYDTMHILAEATTKRLLNRELV